jgi:hypothetical protein
MKKEALFFTDISEIGTQHVPLKIKRYNKGGNTNKEYPIVELQLYADNKEYNKRRFTQEAYFDFENDKIKFVGLDTFGEDYRMKWVSIRETTKGYSIKYAYFGGAVYIENYFQLWDEYNKKTNPKMANGGLIAPNGNPSKLTPEQYKLVRTPEFKAWFGDWENDPENASKVVDENGEPLVLYHGSSVDFNLFENKAREVGRRITSVKGFYFTKDKWSATQYAGSDGFVKSYFLKILNYPSKQDKKVLEYSNIDDYLFDYGKSIDRFGYDGAVDVQGDFIVFESNQIKLADGTNTTFDPSNPDSRFKDGGSIDNERIVCQKCDWSWKVADGGDDLYVCHKCGYDNEPYYATKFAGGGGIDINEPFYVNGKTLAERVRILVKQLYPDYKWSVTSSYSKMDVYLLEADFDPFSERWKEEYPDRDLYYSVNDWDFNEYNRTNKPNISDRAIEVFKPIREYIDKFVYNRNADQPYADNVDYNIYEYTYIGKWDKPYVQVDPKAGKKPKAKPTVTSTAATTTPSPTTITPRADYPFKMGDILAISQEKLNGLSLGIAREVAQFYYEVAEMISTTQQYFIKYNDKNESQTVTVEVLDILKDYVKATAPLFKMGDTVVRKLSPENSIKVVHRSYYEQIAVKYSTPEKRFLLAGIIWNYQLEDGTYANEDELEKYNSSTKNTPEPKFKVGDIVYYRSSSRQNLVKYKVTELTGFSDAFGENMYNIEGLDQPLSLSTMESQMTLVEPAVSSDAFSIQNIVSKTTFSSGLKEMMIQDFIKSGYENVTPLIGEDSNETSVNIMEKVEGFESGKNTNLQAHKLASEIHKLIANGNVPTAEPVSFLDYLVANNEKATLIPRDLEVMNTLALFIQSGKDIEDLDADRYATLLVNMIEKLTPNK